MNSDFDVLRQLLNRRSGLALDAEKAYLAESRLQPLVQQLGVAGLGGLVKLLLSGSHEDLEREVVEAMTTNETFFFRDRVPFDNFRKIILPHLLQARQDSRKIRIWCAACSSGQEPYSLAMTLDEEAHRLAGWSVEILATDLSRSVVNTARQGVYTQFEVQRGLPIAQLLRYFRQEGERWRINEHLQSRIRFMEFNLLSDYASLGRFDVIFCRNVLIYFDVPTKKDVLDRMAKILAPDGFFIMGAAETVIGLTDTMVPHPEHRSISILRAAAPKPPQRLALVAN
ncbi:MAG: protein-glutamate O-methyltransferase CheR [Methylovirgula sp.]|nr:protein-glutamate O-methyltransferase CheR [Methylovirgula sp.]